MRQIAFLILFSLCISCDVDQETEKYMDHIGDTTFDTYLDDPNFEICNPDEVLHSRARVRYEGGNKGLTEQLIDSFDSTKFPEKFTGYFFVRALINCKGEIGRIRYDIIDTEFKKTTCSKELESKILSIVADLNSWYPAQEGENAVDCYTFFIIKLDNGQIIAE